MSSNDNAQATSGRLLILDGHAYAYRAFYAIRQLTSSVTGAPTNAIYGFIQMLTRMRAFLKPTHIVVIWDGGLACERTTLHPEYKIHRPAPPEGLEQQIVEIERFLKCAKITSLCKDGIEADDWIATVALKAKGQGLEVVIASSDKDFFQLIQPGVGLLNPNDKQPRIWGSSEVLEKTGVNPCQVVDWLSLIGDTVDNIPGVPGIGPATATKLLSTHGSISAVYDKIDDVKPNRVRSALLASRELLSKNQALIRLNCTLDEVECCGGFEVQVPDNEQLASCFKEWGFRRFYEELVANGGAKQSFLL